MPENAASRTSVHSIVRRPFTRDELIEHCLRASEIVATWPAWQRNMIEDSLRPEWDKPRDVVWHNAKKPVGD